MSKIFTIFGATGNQGSSVIEHVLAHPKLSKEYKLRAVTRNTSSDAAKALTARGVEVVSGDMENYESISKAIEGSYAVFAVTNYWEKPSKQREVDQGKRIADASKEHGVKQFVWSSLANCEKVSGGKYPHVYHFDGKAEIGDYIASLGIPLVNVLPGYYLQNLKSLGSISKKDGKFTLAYPVPSNVAFPYFNPARDTGLFVSAALLQPELFNTPTPTNIYEASAFVTSDELATLFHSVTGETLNYYQVPDEDFKKFLPTAELGQEMLENYLMVQEYGYFGPDVETAKKDLEKHLQEYVYKVLDGRPQTIEDYLKSVEWS